MTSQSDGDAVPGIALSAVWQDVRYGFRALLRSRAYSVAVLLTLVIALAANTTVLSVIEQVLVRSLPYDDESRLFMMLEGDGKGALRAPSYLTFLDWQQQSQTLDGVTFVRGNGALLLDCERAADDRPHADHPEEPGRDRAVRDALRP